MTPAVNPMAASQVPISPIEIQLELRVLPESSFFRVECCCFSQATIHLGRSCFLFYPFYELLPHSHQAFVGDIDDGVCFEWLVHRWDKKGTAGLSKCLNDGFDFVRRSRSNIAQVV